MKAILTVGISASGKSTWAKEFVQQQKDWILLCSDDIRAELLKERTQQEFNWSLWRKHLRWEKQVKSILWQRVREAAEKAQNIIIANTHLSNHTRLSAHTQLIHLGYEVEEKVFDISFKEACRRDAERLNGVGFDVIAKQLEKFQERFIEKYTPNENLPPCVIFDVDGTLTHNTSGRSPFDWSRVNEDSIDENVKLILTALLEQGMNIVILSGRDSSCRDKTISHLTEHEIFYADFFMRAAEDMRPDDIIKKELFFNHVAPKYCVKFVFDDRPKVCRMWRSLGLTVFQIGNPYIEF